MRFAVVDYDRGKPYGSTENIRVPTTILTIALFCVTS